MYCTVDDIKKYIDDELVERITEAYAGRIEQHISDVSSEIDDVLRGRYILPLTSTPAVINRCCSVLTAYRTLGGITGVMETDKTTDNALMYLQKQSDSANKLLESIRDGKLNLGLAEAKTDSTTSDNEFLTISPRREFDMRGY
ncbi:MAG: phage protein Gp36 family protein [Deferribacterales bacterium]